MLNRELAKGWTSWRDTFISLNNIRFMLTRTVRRIQHQSQFRALHTWRDMYLYNRWLLSLSNSVVGHLAHRDLSRGFNKLQEEARLARLMELNRLNKKKQKVQAHDNSPALESPRTE